MSKGSKQRPTNHESYANSYERIFGKKARVELEVHTIESNTQGKEYDLITFDEASMMEDTSTIVPMMEPALDFTDSIQ